MAAADAGSRVGHIPWWCGGFPPFLPLRFLCSQPPLGWAWPHHAWALAQPSRPLWRRTLCIVKWALGGVCSWGTWKAWHGGPLFSVQSRWLRSATSFFEAVCGDRALLTEGVACAPERLALCCMLLQQCYCAMFIPLPCDLVALKCEHCTLVDGVGCAFPLPLQCAHAAAPVPVHVPPLLNEACALYALL